MMKLANNLQQLKVQKQDYDKRFHVTRALIGLPPSLCYAAWVVTIVPVKLRGCRRRRIRVRRRNGPRRDGGAETAAPKWSCSGLSTMLYHQHKGER